MAGRAAARCPFEVYIKGLLAQIGHIHAQRFQAVYLPVGSQTGVEARFCGALLARKAGAGTGNHVSLSPIFEEKTGEQTPGLSKEAD